MRKSSLESSEKLMSVDDVIRSGPLKLIGQFSCDVSGCNTCVKFVNTNLTKLIRVLQSITSRLNWPINLNGPHL